MNRSQRKRFKTRLHKKTQKMELGIRQNTIKNNIVK